MNERTWIAEGLEEVERESIVWVEGREDRLAIEFTCPKCGNIVTVYEIVERGDTCKCPECHTMFEILAEKHLCLLKIREVEE